MKNGKILGFIYAVILLLPVFAFAGIAKKESPCLKLVLAPFEKLAKLESEIVPAELVGEYFEKIKYWKSFASNAQSIRSATRALGVMELQMKLDMDSQFDIYEHYRSLFYSVKLAYNIALSDLDSLTELRMAQGFFRADPSLRVPDQNDVFGYRPVMNPHAPSPEIERALFETEARFEANLKVLTNLSERFESVHSMLDAYVANKNSPPTGATAEQADLFLTRGNKAEKVLELLSKTNLLKEFFGVPEGQAFQSATFNFDPKPAEIKLFLQRFPRTALWKLEASLRQERTAGLLRLIPRSMVSKMLLAVINKIPFLNQNPLIKEDVTGLLLSFNDRFAYHAYFPSVVEIATSQVSDLIKAKRLDLINTDSDYNEFMITFYRTVDPSLWERMKDAAKDPAAGTMVIYKEMTAAEAVGVKMGRLSIYGPAPIMTLVTKAAVASSAGGILWYLQHHLHWTFKLGKNEMRAPSRMIAEQRNDYEELFGRDAQGWITEREEYRLDQVYDQLEALISLGLGKNWKPSVKGL